MPERFPCGETSNVARFVFPWLRFNVLLLIQIDVNAEIDDLPDFQIVRFARLCQIGRFTGLGQIGDRAGWHFNSGAALGKLPDCQIGMRAEIRTASQSGVPGGVGRGADQMGNGSS